MGQHSTDRLDFLSTGRSYDLDLCLQTAWVQSITEHPIGAQEPTFIMRKLEQLYAGSEVKDLEKRVKAFLYPKMETHRMRQLSSALAPKKSEAHRALCRKIIKKWIFAKWQVPVPQFILRSYSTVDLSLWHYLPLGWQRHSVLPLFMEQRRGAHVRIRFLQHWDNELRDMSWFSNDARYFGLNEVYYKPLA